MLIWPICLIFLLSLILFGNGQVLCVGEDGHIEIETYCLPCCGEAEDTCELDLPEDLHDEHNGCSDCSDFEINSPIWSSRVNHIEAGNFDHSKTLCSMDSNYGGDSTQINISKTDFLIYFSGQGPPSDIGITTVLRC